MGKIDGIAGEKARRASFVGLVAVCGVAALGMDGCYDAPPLRCADWSLRRALVRGPGGLDSRARGAVAIRRTNCNYDSHDVDVLRVHAARLDPEAVYTVYLEDGDSVLKLVGAILTNERGTGTLRQKNSLTEGAYSRQLDVKEFGGRRIEVRDGAGVILMGTVPSRGSRAERVRASLSLEDAGTGIRSTMFASSHPRTGRERLRFETRGLPEGARVEFLLGTPGAGGSDLALVADEVAPADGFAGVYADTVRGTPLPFGLSSIGDLGRRGFQLRVNGEAVFTGVLPDFGGRGTGEE